MSVNRDFRPADMADKSSLMHFFIVVKVGHEYCPLAVVAQSPPHDGLWMNVRKPFVVDRVKGIYEWLTTRLSQYALLSELAIAKDVYAGGRDKVPGGGGNVPASPLLTREEKKALKRDPHPARFPYIAHRLVEVVKHRPVSSLGLTRHATSHWDLAPLGTTFVLKEVRKQAAIFDITDPDNITMGILHHIHVDGKRKRTMHSLKDWCGEESLAEIDDAFPEIPLINESVVRMFWPKPLPPIPEAPPKPAVADSESLIALVKTSMRGDGFVGFAHIRGITARMVAAALTDEDIQEAVKQLAFASDIFSGPEDHEGFEAIAYAVRDLRWIQRVYIAEPPELELTEDSRAKTRELQAAFRKVFQYRCPPDITLGMTLYSSELAKSLTA